MGTGIGTRGIRLDKITQRPSRVPCHITPSPKNRSSSRLSSSPPSLLPPLSQSTVSSCLFILGPPHLMGPPSLLAFVTPCHPLRALIIVSFPETTITLALILFPLTTVSLAPLALLLATLILLVLVFSRKLPRIVSIVLSRKLPRIISLVLYRKLPRVINLVLSRKPPRILNIAHTQTLP
jgi:hypothetical protein